MTAEQKKAKELIEKFNDLIPMESSFNDTAEDAIRKMDNDFNASKGCALLHCDLNLKDLEFTHIGYGKGIISGYQKTKIKFWQTVKQEIINDKR